MIGSNFRTQVHLIVPLNAFKPRGTWASAMKVAFEEVDRKFEVGDLLLGGSAY